jgi:hypothetical protein
MASTPKGALWLLSRRVSDDVGEDYMQNVAVYATSATEARDLVFWEFARLRNLAPDDGAYGETPAFAVRKVELDQPKMIISGITR